MGGPVRVRAGAQQVKRLAILTLSLAVCCKAPEREPEIRPVETRPAETRPAETRREEQREIYVDSVAAENPVVVRGRARTFENAVSLRLRDARGDIITEEHVTSVGDMGRHNPFEARLWVVRDPGGRITIEAFEYSAKDGSIQSLTRKSVAYGVETIPATLVFPLGDCTKMAHFTRKVPKSIAMARLLAEALVAGPVPTEKSAGASSAFPRGSDVRGVNLRDGELTVDFNDRLQNVGGSCAVLAIRQSVTQTLKQLPAVRNVVITAAGSRELALQP